MINILSPSHMSNMGRVGYYGYLVGGVWVEEGWPASPLPS